MTLLHVFNEWVRSWKSEHWYRDNFVHYRALRRAEDVMNQLIHQMEGPYLPVVSCVRDPELEA
jgi:hypothetical protein